MRYEFMKPEMYMRILQAVATGCTRLNDIATRIHAKTTELPPYIDNLMDVDFIFKEYPVTETPRSKKSRYYLKDNFMKFWFRFIFPNLSRIEQGIFDTSSIQALYPEYLGHVFEDAVRQFIIKTRQFPFTMIGRWWWRDVEIDLVAHDDPSGTTTFIECKWNDGVDPVPVIEALEEKAKLVQLPQAKKVFMIFARSYSRILSSWKEIPVHCIDVAFMEREIKNWLKNNA